MSAAKAGLHLKKKPTPDDLAGTPVCREEHNAPARGRGSRSVKVRPRGREGDAAGETQSRPGRPTPHELPGVPVSAEGEEDLRVRPRSSRGQSRKTGTATKR